STLGNGGTYNEAQAIRYVETDEGETIEFESESHQAMEDYTAYMLTDMLKGTFEPYGSADYIQMDGLNIAGKTGTTSYSRSVREEYNLPDNAAKDAWMVGYTPEYTMSVWTGFTATEENGDTSFVGQDEQITPQWFFRDIMQSISTYNGQDFKRPDSVVEISGGELAVRGSEELQSYQDRQEEQQRAEEERREREEQQAEERARREAEQQREEEETEEEETTEESTEEESTEEETT